MIFDVWVKTGSGPAFKGATTNTDMVSAIEDVEAAWGIGSVVRIQVQENGSEERWENEGGR